MSRLNRFVRKKKKEQTTLIKGTINHQKRDAHIIFQIDLEVHVVKHFQCRHNYSNSNYEQTAAFCILLQFD